MADPNHSDRPPHDEAEELLPWYATGQLDAADRARVERHLYSCAACRKQVGVERQLIDEFQAMTPEVEFRLGPAEGADRTAAAGTAGAGC